MASPDLIKAQVVLAGQCTTHLSLSLCFLCVLDFRPVLLHVSFAQCCVFLCTGFAPPTISPSGLYTFSFFFVNLHALPVDQDRIRETCRQLEAVSRGEQFVNSEPLQGLSSHTRHLFSFLSLFL